MNKKIACRDESYLRFSVVRKVLDVFLYHKRVAVLLGACIVGLAWCAAWADSIVLKTGQQIDGTIVEMSNDTVKVNFEGADMTYPFSDVDMINGQRLEGYSAATAADEAPAGPLLEPPPAPEVAVAPAPGEAVKDSASQPATAERAAPATEPVPQSSIARRAPVTLPGPFGNMVPAVVLGFLAVYFVLVIAFYIYMSLCLQMIAKKTNHSRSWLAWIPIANLFLMCKVAGLRYWWMLGILFAVIPFLGALLVLAWSGYIWYKIAVARHKPGWVGILVIIPLVNLVIMGYLAFTD